MVDSSAVGPLSGSCRLAARRSRAFGLEESVLGTEQDFGLVPVIFVRFVFFR